MHVLAALIAMAAATGPTTAGASVSRNAGNARKTADVLEPLALPYSSPASEDRILVILARNSHSKHRSYATLPSMMLGYSNATLADYLKSVSFGRERLRGFDIFGIYPTVVDTLSWPYDGDAAVTGAMAELEADGAVLNWDLYRFFVVIVDDIYDPYGGTDHDGDGYPDLPNGGLPVSHRISVDGGELVIPGAVIAGFLTDNAREFIHAVGHELGHTGALNFPHAGSLDCSQAQGDYFACRPASRTGDSSDVMGNGGYFPPDRPRHYSGLFKAQAGWLDSDNVVSDLGVHQLYPIDRSQGAARTQLVVLPLDELPPFDCGGPGSGMLTIEYRVDEGYDEGLPTGVYLKLKGSDQLWNLTPNPLQPGEVFEDVHNDLRIEVLAEHGDFVSVDVRRR